MHDAFEHVPILEKLPLQIDCLAAWGEPLGPRPCLPRHAGQPPFLFRSSSAALGAAGCGLPGCGVPAVQAWFAAASALRAVP